MLLAGERDHSQDADDDKHDPGQGTGHTHFVALEGVVINQQRNQSCCVTGTAAGDDVGTVEFLERLGNLGNQVVEDNGGDHRDSDGEELAGLGSTVDGGGLIQIRRDALQCGQEQHHGGAELPHTEQADDEQRPGTVGQPGGTLDAHIAQQSVDDAVITEQGAPQNGDSHRTAQNGRDVVYGAEEVDELDLEVKNVGDEQGKDQLEGHGDERIFKGDQQRGRGGLVGENLHIVHDAVLVDALEEVHIREAVKQRTCKRIYFKYKEADNPGNQEE